MRRRAQEGGNLKTTPQQTVTTQNSEIVVEPANPDMVYVPAYDPWVVYGDPILRGRGGTRILESGLAVRTSRSDSASASVGMEGLDGAGVIGDSIGIIDTQFMTTTGTTPTATHFTTGTTTTEVPARAADLTTAAVERVTAPQGAALSTEIAGLLEDMLNPAARAASAQAPSVAAITAVGKGAFRHADSRASAAGVFTAVAAGGFTAVAAGAGNRVW